MPGTMLASLLLAFAPTTVGVAAPPAGGPVTSAPPPASSAPPSAAPPRAFTPPGAATTPPATEAPPPAAVATPPAAASPPAGVEEPIPAGESLTTEAAVTVTELPLAPPRALEGAPPAVAARDDAVVNQVHDTFFIGDSRGVTHLTVVERRPPPPPAVAPNDDDVFISGYGGLVARGTSISGKFGAVLGVRGGMLLGERLSLGGAAYKLERRFGKPIRDPAGNPYNLKMAYGGGELGVAAFRGERLELGFGALVGGGVACVSRDYKYDRDELDCVEAVRLVIVEPEAQLYVYVADWMRLGLTGGYRFAMRGKWRPPNSFTISGAHFGVNLEFGWFDRRT